MTKPTTPEEKASERFPNVDDYAKRWGAATIFREQVEPLEALTTAQAGIISQSGEENARLRALVQVLVDGMAGHARSCVGTCSCGFYGRIASALIAAKEQGFVPTNTEDK